MTQKLSDRDELPAELQHPDVIGVRNRSEPKRDCYHVVIDGADVPTEYRRQWEDDWEILTAAIEWPEAMPHGHDVPCIRLVLLERLIQ